METGLAGKVALVTGGAGGIGSAISRAFAAEGMVVAVHYHASATAAERLAGEIGGLAVQADLTDPAATDAMFAAVIEGLGRLDVCAANAGRWPATDTPIWEMDPGRWERTVADNLRTVFLTARGFLRHAAGTGRGALVLTGSTAGIFGEAGHADYAAAKGAIVGGLLKTLKNETARIGGGVRVNAVAPGWIVTPQRAAAGIDQAHVDRATATMSLKKLGTPQDVAAQVVVLASDRLSGHLSGEVIAIAGGMEGRIVP